MLFACNNDVIVAYLSRNNRNTHKQSRVLQMDINLVPLKMSRENVLALNMMIFLSPKAYWRGKHPPLPYMVGQIGSRFGVGYIEGTHIGQHTSVQRRKKPDIIIFNDKT